MIKKPDQAQGHEHPGDTKENPLFAQPVYVDVPKYLHCQLLDYSCRSPDNPEIDNPYQGIVISLDPSRSLKVPLNRQSLDFAGSEHQFEKTMGNIDRRKHV